MKNRKMNPARRAMITTEIIIGIFLMMVLSVLAADTIFDYRDSSDAYFWRRAAGWAADAQLQRYQAGAAIDSPPPGLIPEEITLKTSRQPGEGQWKGFSRVTVTATVIQPTGKLVREQISGYVRAEGGS